MEEIGRPPPAAAAATATEATAQRLTETPT